MRICSRTALWLGLALGSATVASAVQVTFQVNMLAQTVLGNFNPQTDTVVVAGDPINGWSTAASPLASSAADTNIWVGTFDVPGSANTTVQYKFVMNNPGGVVWEGQVGPGGGTGNRTFVLGSADQTLPAVYFNNVTNTSSSTTEITLHVNMAIQTTMGSFDPSAGVVNVAGEFNNWNATSMPMTNSVADTNIWETTLTLTGAVGSQVNYKYIMNGSWEGNVGPGGAQNRVFTLWRTNQTIPAVYFNNLSSVPVPMPLVFQVNMAAQNALGNFDPATDMVEARGSFNNWNAGFVLTNSPDNTNLFSGTWIDSSDVPGNSIQYQFVLNNGTTWETGVGNRNYMITSTNEQTVPLVFFNNISNVGTLALQTAAGGQVTLSWTAAPLVRLQTAPNAAQGPWQDVPNTTGQSSATLTPGPGPRFYRLIGP